MSDIADSDFNRLKRAIMKRHLEQLQKHDLSVPKNPRREGDPPPPNLYDLLVQWTNDKIYGGPFGSDLDFNNAFVAFMESVAVYLRDDFQVIKAVNAYRFNKDSDEAFRLLESSVSDINNLLHPDRQTFLVGPYCGVFIPKDLLQSDNSFIGVAFKGTGLPGEDINDIFAVSPTSSPDWLWGSQVGEDIIQTAISTFASLSKSTITHVTGHSLGAAYATLTYAKLSIKGVNNANAMIGDLYAFGAPRVGLEDFAIPARDAVHSGGICKGSSWRIVNNNDFVTTVPIIPLPLLSLLPYFLEPFIHIDAAYEIYPDKNPEQKPSEIGTYPPAEWSLTTDFLSHDPVEYYKSMVYTMTGKPPINDDAVPVQWGGLSVAREIPKGISFQKQLEVKCTFASNHGRVIGRITYGSFVGEITALGSFATPEMEGKAYIYLNSWKDLYKGRNKCLFQRISDSSLGLTFTLGNDTPVAFVDLPISSQHTGEVNLTAGTCNWRFNRTNKVIAAEKSFAVFAKVLAELFEA